MSFEVHALMQNADDFDVRRYQAIKQQVRPGRILPIAASYIVAGFSELRISRNQSDRGFNLTDVKFGLVHAPNDGCMIPNPIDIPLGTGRQ